MKTEAEIRAEWLARLHSTAPAERPRAEAGVRALYTAAAYPEARHLVWFDSPFAASWGVAVLAERHHFLWAQKMAAAAKSRDDRAEMDRARATLGAQLGLPNWEAVVAAFGAPMGSSVQFPPAPERMLKMKIFEARYDVSDDIAGMMERYGIEDDLSRAEQRFWGSNLGALRSALHCPTTDALIGQSFAEDYPFALMADHEHLVGDGDAPPIMRAAWEVARSAGMWWPFEHGAILSERPTELHLNDAKLLERGDGPAAVYPDGRRVYAWNGKAVPERWILEPEKVPSREFQGFDPTFRTYIQSRVGKAPAAKKKAKPASILEAALPSDAAARLEQLRASAGGRLPLFDRYMAGEYRAVWKELVALGAAVRTDPHAADALAVAYETMQRVDANVRTLIERLTAMGYRFAERRPHTPPTAGVQKEIAALEKEHGALPLSLRAFYETVGEVNLIGRHPRIDPPGNDVAPDPLVVYGFDERLVEDNEDDEEDDEGGRQSAITIAPDDLHKADTSGGDPYEIAIPDLRADGELLNERHGVLFVDYLRLCFEFGGFPGYEGTATIPAEIESLKAGLLEL